MPVDGSRISTAYDDGIKRENRGSRFCAYFSQNNDLVKVTPVPCCPFYALYLLPRIKLRVHVERPIGCQREIVLTFIRVGDVLRDASDRGMVDFEATSLIRLEVFTAFKR